MTDSEKKTWLQVLLAILAVPLLMCVLFVLLPNGGGAGGDSDLAALCGWWTICVVGAYLLVLSWRAAYISGRRKR